MSVIRAGIRRDEKEKECKYKYHIMPKNIKSFIFFSVRVYQNRQLKMSRAVRRPTFRVTLNTEVSKDE